MAKELRRIPLDEFAGDARRIFELVSREHEAVVVENEAGEGVLIQPLAGKPSTRTITEEDYQAFRRAFGSWADVDTDTLKQTIYESRKSSRPPVDL